MLEIEERESVMPLESILYVGFVISAFAVFAAVLAYADWATRHATDNTPRRGQLNREASLHREESASFRKAA
jgi:hypothetical protein